MFATCSVNLTPTTLLALMDHLRASGADPDPAAAVDAAIRHWLAAVKGGDAGASRDDKDDDNTGSCNDGDKPPRGYQWKSLFLPEGTWLRMICGDESEYAIVKGDRLMYQGRPTSPNRFASEQANSVRNAWHDLTIRMPGEKTWKRAYQRRRELQQAEAAAAATAAALPTTSAAGAGAADIPRTTGVGSGSGGALPGHLAHSADASHARSAKTMHAGALPAASADNPLTATGTPLAALIATAAAAVAAALHPAQTANEPPPKPRDTSPGVGWTEPERRKLRFRLEDVAFE